MNEKEIGTMLYMYYMNNYCEDTFSFDNGETFNKVKAYYNKIKEKYSEEEIRDAESTVKIRELEGTDYDYMEFYYEEVPEIVFQVTAMFDYDNNPVEGYTGDSNWADVGIFFVDGYDCEFDNLEYDYDDDDEE